MPTTTCTSCWYTWLISSNRAALRRRRRFAGASSTQPNGVDAAQGVPWHADGWQRPWMHGLLICTVAPSGFAASCVTENKRKTGPSKLLPTLRLSHTGCPFREDSQYGKEVGLPGACPRFAHPPPEVLRRVNDDSYAAAPILLRLAITGGQHTLQRCGIAEHPWSTPHTATAWTRWRLTENCHDRRGAFYPPVIESKQHFSGLPRRCAVQRRPWLSERLRGHALRTQHQRSARHRHQPAFISAHAFEQAQHTGQHMPTTTLSTRPEPLLQRLQAT